MFNDKYHYITHPNNVNDMTIQPVSNSNNYLIDFVKRINEILKLSINDDIVDDNKVNKFLYKYLLKEEL